jgi:repressor LexA
MTTLRESQLLDVIKSHIGQHGIPPTYAEMATGMGFRSKSDIARLLGQLEGQGQVVMGDKYSKRSLMLTGRCPACGRT